MSMQGRNLVRGINEDASKKLAADHRRTFEDDFGAASPRPSHTKYKLYDPILFPYK